MLDSSRVRQAFSPRPIAETASVEDCGGKHDAFFVPAGAEAYRRDNPNATAEFPDTGHFALETHIEEIAFAMRQLLVKSAA
jgi:pimeloyl-ACP methyl ester carboxylesterase